MNQNAKYGFFFGQFVGFWISINQNLFLSSHALIIPTNPDPFSVMAINTLKSVFPRWVLWKKNSISLFADSPYQLLEGEPKFLGTLIQRFNIRRGRPAKPYQDNIEQIKEIIKGDFFEEITKVEMTLNQEQYTQEFIDGGYCLDEIPDFLGLLPKSYQAGVPVFELTDNEINETGTVLEGMKTSRDKFQVKFQSITDKLVQLLNYV